MLLITSIALTTLAIDPARKEEDTRRLHPKDVFELEYGSDPRISPDGERVVYVRNFMDAMTDRRRSNLWIADALGRDHRPLTSGDGTYASPRWSPDGERLAFVASATGTAQIHVRWMDTGQEAALTHLTRSPAGIAWSPDGRALAFTMLVEETPEPFVTPPPKPEGAEWADPPKVITALHYRADGAGYLEQGHRQLFVLSAEGGTARQITYGPHDIDASFAWTPDGHSIVVSSNRRADEEREPNDNELYAVSLADGSLRALTDRYGPDSGPAVSPDGQRVAYVGFDDALQGYQVRGLYLAPMEPGGEPPKLLTAELDRSVRALHWTSDGARVLFLYDDEGRTKLGYATLDGATGILADNLGGESLGRPYAGGAFTVAADGRVAHTLTSPERPADIAVLDPDGGSRLVTQLNDDLLAHKDLGRVEELWCESSIDGRKVQAWLVHPPRFDPAQTYPLILEIHGGPFANYGARFSAECQLYAAAGYAVLYVNPRGSTSYGEEFGNLIHHAYPGNDYHDLMSAVDAVLARGFVDPDRLFVTGGSGGGVLTAWIVGKTDRFRAAVVAKPVIHWTSFALTADMYDFFYKYWFPGYPWEFPEHYWERSPLSLVGNVETPTMILTGEADYRTPMSESEQYYQALKLRGIDTALVRVPDASHGIARRPSHLIAKVAHVLKWFELHAERATSSTDGESATPRDAISEFNRALADLDRTRARFWTLDGEVQDEFFEVTYSMSEILTRFRERFVAEYGEDALPLLQTPPGAQLDYMEAHADEERLASMVVEITGDIARCTFEDGVTLQTIRQDGRWKVDAVGTDDPEALDAIRASLAPQLALAQILKNATAEIDDNELSAREFDIRLGEMILEVFLTLPEGEEGR